MRNPLASVRRGIGLALLLVPLIVLGCSTSPTAPTLVVDAGTVRHVDLEGGFFAIFGDGGRRYEPVNLASPFQVDGKRVRFVAETVPGYVSYRMWGGQAISIRQIEALP